MDNGAAGETKERTRTTERIKTPDMFRVVLHNDDYTTMEFVVEVIIKIFRRSIMDATKIMLHVHKSGKGTVGVYTHDIAATRVRQTLALAHQHDYPLRCTMEKV